MSGRISINLDDWNAVTNSAKSNVNTISSNAMPQLDLLTNNIPDIFEIQQLASDLNDVINRYKEVALRDIEKMQEAGARSHETDLSGAAEFKASIV